MHQSSLLPATPGATALPMGTTAAPVGQTVFEPKKTVVASGEKVTVPVKTLWAILFLAVAIVFNNIGNLLVKRFADVVMADLSPANFALFFAAGATCALALVFYTKALATIPLSVAYPILVGATLVGTAVAGYVLFNEPLSHAQYAGVGLIFAGIVLLSANGRHS